MEITERYPKDFQEFLSQFKSDDDCWDYIGSAVKLRLRLDIKFDENRLFV